MGGDRFGAALAIAALENHQRLAAGGLFGRDHKGPAIGYAFNIGGDDPRLGIAGHGRQHLRFADVHLVAQARDAREADAGAARPINDHCAHRP